jgi:hypothetical protein
VNENAVVGIDIEMPTIQDIVRNHGITPSTSIALTDQQGQLLAWKNGQISSYKPQISVRKDGSSGMPLLAEQDAPVLNQIRKILPLSQPGQRKRKVLPLIFKVQPGQPITPACIYPAGRISAY